MSKGIIYYTDNQLKDPIFTLVQEYIYKANLPIVSVSLKPIAFGFNTVIEGKPSYPTLITQIITALRKSIADYVFFCEHDVLYHTSHFDFTPANDRIFFYNNSIWRWKFLSDIAIKYDRMLPLSSLCVNRKFALDHYEMREKKIQEYGLEKFSSREPSLARIWGYEPGTKKKRRGGLTNDDFETWSSEFPNIDIRHEGTFSPAKCTLDSFKHPPINWREISIDDIPGWNLRELFNYGIK